MNLYGVHKLKNLTCSVHGDDFTTVGPKSALDNFVVKLRTKYELKEAARLGAGEGDDKEARVLNRIVRWTSEGLEYEADPRHVEIIFKQLNIGECKVVSTLGTREEGRAKLGDQRNDWIKTVHSVGYKFN